MVEHITYKKKKYPVKMGYYALKRLQQNHGASLEDVQKDMGLYEPFLFYSLEKGHKLEGKEMPFKMEDMEDVVEECFVEMLALFPKFFPFDMEKMMGERVAIKSE